MLLPLPAGRFKFFNTDVRRLLTLGTSADGKALLAEQKKDVFMVFFVGFVLFYLFLFLSESPLPSSRSTPPPRAPSPPRA